MKTHDLIGIGFGPSNIALAIALEEQRQNGHHIDALFIEKQPHFAWHKDMLLDGADTRLFDQPIFSAIKGIPAPPPTGTAPAAVRSRVSRAP